MVCAGSADTIARVKTVPACTEARCSRSPTGRSCLRSWSRTSTERMTLAAVARCRFGPVTRTSVRCRQSSPARCGSSQRAIRCSTTCNASLGSTPYCRGDSRSAYSSPRMLTLHGVSKSYGDRVLFADAALQVNTGDRIGLVGPNGAGKSTLFGLILGEEPADEGRIVLRPRCDDRLPAAGECAGRRRDGGRDRLQDLARLREADAQQVKAWDQGASDRSAHPEELHDDVHERFHEQNGYMVEAKAKQMLAGLGFKPERLRSAGEGAERWLGDARAPGAAARAGTRPADARRADQPPRPRVVAVVPAVPAGLSGRDPGDLARPRVPERTGHRIVEIRSRSWCASPATTTAT
jgi:energy-coupling factor transporter ATP-binding protein EcfA2